MCGVLRVALRLRRPVLFIQNVGYNSWFLPNLDTNHHHNVLVHYIFLPANHELCLLGDN